MLKSIVCAAALLGACATPPPPPRSQESLLLGERMPSFDTQTLSGKRVSSDEYGPQPIVVTFVATRDCATCTQTLQAAESLFHERRDVVVLSVFRGKAEEVRSTASNLKLSYPVVWDEERLMETLFQVAEVPRTFVIDANGWVRWVGGPNMTEQDLRTAVEAFPKH